MVINHSITQVNLFRFAYKQSNTCNKCVENIDQMNLLKKNATFKRTKIN